MVKIKKLSSCGLINANLPKRLAVIIKNPDISLAFNNDFLIFGTTIKRLMKN
jgi:hypothetical protein